MGQPIFIGLGSNLPSPEFGPPRAVVAAAVAALGRADLRVRRRSRWYASAALPLSSQPEFVNGVVEIESMLEPPALMAALHAIEAAFGRKRSVRDAPRVLDLDLLIMGDLIRDAADSPTLPHPRLHLRAFVLRPLADLTPDWRHPLLGRTTSELLDALAPGQRVEPLDDMPADAGAAPPAGLSAEGALQQGRSRA